ncbi:MAG: GIY-YIG nuclease family protein [Chloroflexota bacterium]|nr:GIY-YIG nuclease family protein [Chloroflexota bacterium]
MVDGCRRSFYGATREQVEEKIALHRQHVNDPRPAPAPQAAPARQPKVYLIQVGNNGPIKIGQAVDPPSRLRELQVSHAERLILLAVIEDLSENELHERFYEHHIRGEWFAPAHDILALAAAHS